MNDMISEEPASSRAPAPPPTADSPDTELAQDDQPLYGQLILLGCHFLKQMPLTATQSRRTLAKLSLRRRDLPNGLKRTIQNVVRSTAQLNDILQSKIYATAFVDGYSSKGRQSTTNAVVVDYEADANLDMFQVGRSSDRFIDFPVMDTLLATQVTASSSNNMAQLLREQQLQIQQQTATALGSNPAVSSTISRYACRVQVERSAPHRAFLYASAFNWQHNIIVSDKNTKWENKDSSMDALTTNGVLFLTPTAKSAAATDTECSEEEGSGGPTDSAPFLWHEVSIDGRVYKLRPTRASSQRGEPATGVTNQLQDGTLIDICGATLLWRSAAGLAGCPTRHELNAALDAINSGRPQCPVSLNTLVVPRRRPSGTSSRQPYAYAACGHVQGRHEWGRVGQGSLRCPICMTDSTHGLRLSLGLEPALHRDSTQLDHAFNPCGHVVSITTAQYWSRIALPFGTSNFSPVCPFCSIPLMTDKPYIRVIFQ